VHRNLTLAKEMKQIKHYDTLPSKQLQLHARIDTNQVNGEVKQSSVNIQHLGRFQIVLQILQLTEYHHIKCLIEIQHHSVFILHIQSSVFHFLQHSHHSILMPTLCTHLQSHQNLEYFGQACQKTNVAAPLNPSTLLEMSNKQK
jgi:hypothetical protein